MGNFDRGGSKGGFRGGDRGGKPSFQKKSWGNDRGGDMPMHKATCSECGRACEVPFRPTGEKPVFCRDCFASKREGGDRGDRGARPDFNNRGPKRDFGEKPNLSFAPRTDFKPAPVNDETKKQLTDISYKLERLLASMDRLMDITRKEVSVVKVAPAPAVTQKVETTKAPMKAVTKVAAKTVAKVAPKKVVEKKVVVKKKK